MTEGTLTIDFIGERYEVKPGDQFTFGRQADLTVDDSNPFLHRRLGTFTHLNGVWTLHNSGTRLPITIVIEGHSSSDLQPGATVSIYGEHAAIRFEAAGLRYEIDCFLDEPPDVPAGGPDQDGRDPEGDPTREWGVVPLNFEQRQLLVSLAEPLLRDGVGELPTNNAAARRLGWSVTKFNRKLDYLCERYSRAGVPGLAGERGLEANRRRQRLVDHVVKLSIIGPDDLEYLDIAAQ